MSTSDIWPFALLLAAAVATAAEPVRSSLSDARLSADGVPTFQRIEMRFPHCIELDNPDDPRQVCVEGIFTSPSGKSWPMPGFLCRDFQCTENGLKERSHPEWCVRFTPIEPGRWTARLQVTVMGKADQREVGSFEVSKAKGRGFLRRARANPLALEFQNGDPLEANERLWTDSAVRRLFWQKIRYCVARWGRLDLRC